MNEGFGDAVDRIRSDHHGKGRRTEEISNAVHFDCLLRPRGERPCSRCTTDQADKFPPPHVYTQDSGQGIVPGQTGIPEGIDRCPLWVKSRHVHCTRLCLLYPNSDRESRHPQTVMSALPPKADMCGALARVCF